jgi:glucose/mannose-6-phosphate isomerase
LKICCNENAKNLAWSNQYPEFNHNEFIGWSSHPVDKPFGVVEIRSNLEHERTQKRFVVTEKLFPASAQRLLSLHQLEKPHSATALDLNAGRLHYNLS